MRHLCSAIALCLCVGTADAARFLKGTRAGGGSASLTWIAPERGIASIGGAGGAAITPPAGYKVYKSAVSQVGPWTLVADAGNVLTYNVTGLTSGTWYFAVSSYDAGGREGPPSMSGSKTL